MEYDVHDSNPSWYLNKNTSKRKRPLRYSLFIVFLTIPISMFCLDCSKTWKFIFFKVIKSKTCWQLFVLVSCSMLQKLCQLMAPFRNVSNRFRFMLDLPTSRAQIFSRARTVSDRLFMFSASKVSERAKLDLFPLQKIALKNFVLRVLKTKQVGNVFSLRGCQENPTLVKYPNGGRQNAH